MKQDILQTLKITAIALALTLGVNYVFAWTGPTATAPNGNTSTPINVGATNQIKDAGLGINALSVFGNSFIQGVLGIGDSTPDGTLKLDVEGNVGATQYCDQNGANCKTTAEMGGGGTNFWTQSGTNIYSNNTGAVGIGDTTPDTGLKLDVEGKVGATQYCDQNGANCKATTAMGIGSLSCTDVWAYSSGMAGGYNVTATCGAGYSRTGCNTTVGNLSLRTNGCNISGNSTSDTTYGVTAICCKVQ